MNYSVLKRAAISIIAAVTVSVSGTAQQKGDMAVGANLLFGTTSGYSNIGLGPKFLYNVTDKIRLAGEFDYFLKKDYVSFWDISVYGHYLFPIAENIVVYPSVGLGILGSTVKVPSYNILGITYGGGSTSGTDFALSLGGGIDYALTPKLTLNGELRYKVVSGGWFNIAVGISYKL